MFSFSFAINEMMVVITLKFTYKLGSLGRAQSRIDFDL